MILNDWFMPCKSDCVSSIYLHKPSGREVGRINFNSLSVEKFWFGIFHNKNLWISKRNLEKRSQKYITEFKLWFAVPVTVILAWSAHSGRVEEHLHDVGEGLHRVVLLLGHALLLLCGEKQLKSVQNNKEIQNPPPRRVVRCDFFVRLSVKTVS